MINLLPRRGGAPSGAAELLARGGMGAIPPPPMDPFQSPDAPYDPTRTFLWKHRVAS